MSNFKVYDPVAELIAAGPGTGGGLPSTGGTLTGNLTMQVPSKVVQCEPPIDPCDLTNKTYVDSLIGGGPFLPLAGGTLNGNVTLTAPAKIVQSQAPVNGPDLANKTYVDSLIGGGPFLPLAGGTLNGNVTLTAPAKIVQSQAPVNGPDLANKTYVDASIVAIGTGPFLPLVGGTMTGAIVQPLAPNTVNDLTNKAYVDTQISTLNVPDASSLVKGKIQLSGDLTGTATLPRVANLAIDNSKLDNFTNTKMLKGSSSLSLAATDISLGPGLDISGTQLNILTNSLDKAGNTQFGLVEFDPSGDLTETFLNSGIAKIQNLAISNSKLANFASNSQLKGSASAGPTSAVDITLGAGLSMATTTLSVDATSLPIIPVSKGGTGAMTLTGYLQGNGTSPITTISSIPVIDINGAVGSVNGIFPTPTNGGNVAVFLGGVSTGTLAAIPAQPQPNGDIYVVSGDPTPVNDGRTFISDGAIWLEVTTNQAATDARYVLKAGDAMTGDLSIPNGVKVLLNDLPTGGTDAANKNYVDTLVASSAVPDATTVVKGKIQLAGDFDPTSTASVPVIKSATTTIQGKIQLAGDLTGTAASPLVANLAITNSKLANLTLNSQLKGSASIGPTSAADISLGPNLVMSGSTLDVDTSNLQGTFLPLIGGTLSGDLIMNSGTNILIPDLPLNPIEATNKGYVDSIITPPATTLIQGKIKLGGDLSGVGTTADAPVITNSAVTNIKLNPGLSSTLKGTNGSTVVSDITLGSGLSMPASTLQIDMTAVQKAGSAQFGVVEFDSSGDLDPTSTNSGIAVIKPQGVTNSKINPGATSTLKGTNGSTVVSDIALGSGLSMPASTLQIDMTAVQKAGSAQFGVVEFDSSGDLDATSANSGIALVGSNKITYSKIQQAAPSTIMGTPSNNTNPGNFGALTLGSSMSLTGLNGTPATGNVLNSAISFVTGTNPNITAPVDRPATSNIAYIGNNGSLWIWNGSSYIAPSGTAQLIKSTTTYLIGPTPTPSLDLPMTDYNIIVPDGATLKALYMFRYQFSANAYAPAFTFIGPVAGDFFYGILQRISGNAANATPITMVAFNTDNILFGDVLIDSSNPPNMNGLVNPDIYNTNLITVEYTNNSGSNKTIIPIFQRDVPGAGGQTIRCTGGSVEYRIYT